MRCKNGYFSHTSNKPVSLESPPKVATGDERKSNSLRLSAQYGNPQQFVQRSLEDWNTPSNAVEAIVNDLHTLQAQTPPPSNTQNLEGSGDFIFIQSTPEEVEQKQV